MGINYVRNKERDLHLIYQNIFQEMCEDRKTLIQISILYSTLSLLAIGWFSINFISLSNAVKICIWFVYLILTIYISIYLERVRKHFSDSARIIHRCEYIFGAYEKHYFASGFSKDTEDALFPSDWSTFGTSEWKEHSIMNSKGLVIATFLMTSLVLLAIALLG
ncbi:MAG: hypothetical protein HC850_09845 [Rhodomicrobium sp.]|nr:hypothetical protein [Rhodomicrobium sp.]